MPDILIGRRDKAEVVHEPRCGSGQGPSGELSRPGRQIRRGVRSGIFRGKR
jgi:hypothetical protein